MVRLFLCRFFGVAERQLPGFCEVGHGCNGDDDDEDDDDGDDGSGDDGGDNENGDGADSLSVMRCW